MPDAAETGSIFVGANSFAQLLLEFIKPTTLPSLSLLRFS